MTNNDIKKIKQLLENPKRIAIIPHKNPDGDAMGSTIGLYHYLRSKGHDALVITPNDYPYFLKWIPGEDSVLKHDQDEKRADEFIQTSDIIFTLDFNDLSRAGAMETVLSSAGGIKILIDHHQQPQDYAKFLYSDVSMCSTAEMIYHFLEMLEDTQSINESIATCLYLGIMTDTGSFRYRSTTSTTHRVVAQLIDKGADHAQIHNNVYSTNSYNKLQLLGQSLQNLKVIPELRTAYISLSQDELDRHNFKKGDTEGVVNYALSLENTELGVIFIENQHEKIIKMSLRSSGSFDVNAFARKHFNGGGHVNAAGGRSTLSLKETIDKFLDILPEYANALNK
jgi:phosphoesterase RecJ-like protein